MILASRRYALASQPFAGSGVSVYAAAGEDPPAYRLRRTVGRRPAIRSSAPSAAKTARVASGAALPIAYDVPAEWLPGFVTIDVRTFAAGIECEATGPVTLLLDASGDEVVEYLPHGRLLGVESRAGGLVTLRLDYAPGPAAAPASIVAVVTAGPTVSVAAGGPGSYRIDLPALADGDHEVTVSAGGRELFTTIVTADGTGPAAATRLTAEVV